VIVHNLEKITIVLVVLGWAIMSLGPLARRLDSSSFFMRLLHGSLFVHYADLV
jgi:hypothetical protein